MNDSDSCAKNEQEEAPKESLAKAENSLLPCQELLDDEEEWACARL